MAELEETRGNSPSRRWTRPEEQLLRRLATDRVPLKDIAARLNRTVSAVRSKAAHLRVPMDFGDLRSGGRRPMPWDHR